MHAAGHHGFKGAGGAPLTSDLSGQDFWTLLQAGYRPLELVMGSCVYHVAHQGFFQSIGQVGRNVEMTNFTQALYNAREIAMERMQNEATAAGAEGVVGMELHEGSHHYGFGLRALGEMVFSARTSPDDIHVVRAATTATAQATVG